MEGLIVDNFAGGGGASEGLEGAFGRPADIAVNHSAAAIAMHRANHPTTKHYQEDVLAVDPREACGTRPVAAAWFSPDCTHFSRAKGGQPRSKEVRCLADVVIRWAETVRPRVVFLENVEEFQTWGPLSDEGHPIKGREGEDFRAWRAKLVALGYVVDHRVIVAADHGTPTTRKRFFLVARCDGAPIVWPEATHGKGRAHAWRPAADVIDWTLPCPSIFERRKPLKEATLRRIAAGLRRYVMETSSPFIVPLTHHGERRTHPLHEPLPTITAANRGELAVVAPFVSTQFGQSVGRGVEAPLPTITGGGMGHQALVAPTLIQTGYGEREGQAPRALDLHRPLGTVVAGGQKHALVAAFLAKHYGGVVGHGVERPIGAVTARDHHSLVTAQLSLNLEARAEELRSDHTEEVRAFLVAYYGSEREGQSPQLPLRTVPTHDRFGLVMVRGVAYRIVDIGMRMLSPRELFNAQGFRPDYIIDPELGGRRLTKTEQIECAGNSVCPKVARAIVHANVYQRAVAA